MVAGFDVVLLLLDCGYSVVVALVVAGAVVVDIGDGAVEIAAAGDTGFVAVVVAVAVGCDSYHDSG